MVRSPKGLLEVKPTDESVSLEGNIRAVEEWANKILRDAGIELRSDAPLELAYKRPQADQAFWALISIHQALRVRQTLKIAAETGAEQQAKSSAEAMWQMCGAAYAGRFVLNEDTLSKGIRFTEGPKQPRRDALAECIDTALRDLGPDTMVARILEYIRDKAPIQEIDSDLKIFWLDQRGKQQETSFKAFQNRVAKRRKVFTKTNQRHIPTFD